MDRVARDPGQFREEVADEPALRVELLKGLLD